MLFGGNLVFFCRDIGLDCKDIALFGTCSVLQCVAVYCSVCSVCVSVRSWRRFNAASWKFRDFCTCRVLQCFAVYVCILQCVAQTWQTSSLYQCTAFHSALWHLVSGVL